MRLAFLMVLGFSGLILTSCSKNRPELPASRTAGDEPAAIQHDQHSAADGKASPGNAGHSTDPRNNKSHTEGLQPETEKAATRAPQVRDWDWNEDRRVSEANNWIWTGADLGEGFKQAGTTGKPLMVVLRCPP